jgi:hypothetical protein
MIADHIHILIQGLSAQKKMFLDEGKGFGVCSLREK